MTSLYEPLLTRLFIQIDRLRQEHNCPEFMVWSEAWLKENDTAEAKANCITTRNFFEEKKDGNFISFILTEGMIEMSLCVKIALLYTTGILNKNPSNEGILYNDMELLIGGLELQVMVTKEINKYTGENPPPAGTTIH